jgi:hypothetical protein
VVISRSYPLLEVLFIFPKFCHKAPSGLGVMNSSWEELTRGCALVLVLENGRTVRPSLTDGT